MVENIFVKIIFFAFVGAIIYLIYNFYLSQYLSENMKCNLDDYDIDNMVVIKRTPEYSNLINDLVDKKSFIFSKNQLNVLKNPQQIFNVSNQNTNKMFNISTNPNDQTKISNISDVVYINCKNQLKNNTFDFSDNNSDNDDNINIENIENIENAENFDNLVDVSSKEYIDIETMLKNDINKLIGPNCYNTGVLKNNMPLIKNYLKNYYQDLYGNKIDAKLEDYFAAYYTLINNDNNVGLPVETLIGNSNFIIPDQYIYNSPLTNAYNIDWSRIINPIGYSQ